MKIKLIEERNPQLTPVEQILVNRGISLEDIPKYLNTDDSVISDPYLLDNIQEAADKLISHLEKQSKILIVVDCDADGFTSSAELTNYLYANFNSPNIKFQIHSTKFHGVEKVDEIIQNGFNLVIIPDAGSNQYEDHKKLYEAGIDVIVLDHHDCEKYSEYAIVVNNQLSKNYPNKGLCGAGVVFQFLRILDNSDSALHLKKKKAVDYIDLAALGLIADMSDMKDLETKRLIELGIDALSAVTEDFVEKNANRFLCAMVEKNSYSIGPVITAISLAFYVAPFVNAVVRVGTDEEKTLTFMAMIDKYANVRKPSTKRGKKPGDTESYVEQAVRVLTNVKNRQAKTRDTTFEELEKTITEESLKTNSVIVLDTKGELDKNLNGLVANQIMAKYARPVFVICEREDGSLAGSARNYECEQLGDFRAFVEESGFAEYATGHPSAFGCHFKDKKALENFLEYANSKLSYENFEPEYQVDFIINGSENVSDMATRIGELKPLWGKGLQEPLILFNKVKVTTSNKVLYSPDKKPTLKIISNGVSFISFNFDKDVYNQLAPTDTVQTLMNIIGKCELNHFNGKVYPQVKIVDYEIVGTIPYF